MLGEKIGDFRGKVTGKRVMAAEDGRPKIETSFEITGTILGTGATLLGTYWTTVRPDGSLYGECPTQGIVMTADGGTGTWAGAGVGRFTGKGSGTSFRGAVYFQSVPEKLNRLTKVAALYEWEVDENGDGQCTFWEWK